MSDPDPSPQQTPSTDPATGTSETDRVVGSLQDLDQRPVHEHVAVYDQADKQLRAALDQVGEETTADQR